LICPKYRNIGYHICYQPLLLFLEQGNGLLANARLAMLCVEQFQVGAAKEIG
jgi:hypothetical protein